MSGGVCHSTFCWKRCRWRLRWSTSRFSPDTRAYDAYVVYQMQHLDQPTEDTLCQFITSSLPSVLEDKCGYQLFIQGRDDPPGEGQHAICCFKSCQGEEINLAISTGNHSPTQSMHIWLVPGMRSVTPPIQSTGEAVTPNWWMGWWEINIILDISPICNYFAQLLGDICGST